MSTERHNKCTASSLSELWCIGPNRATAIIKIKTQRGTRSTLLPLSRQYRADRMFNYKILNDKFATDHLFYDVKSLNQNIGA